VNQIPEELRPWVDQLRHRIDSATPNIPDCRWTRTEIGALCVSLWFQGFSEALMISDDTPGMPPGIAEHIHASPGIRQRIASACSQIASAVLDEVDRVA
jgi:hypothetical protein